VRRSESVLSAIWTPASWRKCSASLPLESRKWNRMACSNGASGRPGLRPRRSSRQTPKASSAVAEVKWLSALRKPQCWRAPGEA
jgi:hypothetical protein